MAKGFIFEIKPTHASLRRLFVHKDVPTKGRTKPHFTSQFPSFFHILRRFIQILIDIAILNLASSPFGTLGAFYGGAFAKIYFI